MKNGTLVSLLLLVIIFSACRDRQDTQKLTAQVDSLKSALDSVVDTQSTEEANKKMVAEFYQKLFGDKDLNAIDQYLLASYVQHNPMLPDGSAALKQAAGAWFADAPKERVDIRHLSADGDLVYIHTRANLGGKTFSVIDIFRVENGKIAEHWDVLQEVPAKSANEHPMF